RTRVQREAGIPGREPLESVRQEPAVPIGDVKSTPVEKERLMAGNLAQRLAAFALDTGFEDLPATVVVEARRRLLDSLGCAVGALKEPAPTIARRAAMRVQGTPSVSLIGGGASAPDWAAFANGVHIRYLDCNDTYLSLEPAHPSDNWAAVMACGQLAAADGRAWIAAAAVAYEVQCRLADAAGIRAPGWAHTAYA